MRPSGGLLKELSSCEVEMWNCEQDYLSSSATSLKVNQTMRLSSFLFRGLFQ